MRRGLAEKEVLEKIRRAVHRRSVLFNSGAEVFRLFDGIGDGIERLIVDRFDSVALVHLFHHHSQTSVNISKDLLISVLGSHLYQLLTEWKVKGFVLKIHSGDAKCDSLKSENETFGTVDRESFVTEAGITYRIDPLSNLNPGLFVDTREIRRRISGQAVGKRVLNTFCYTGSLGLAAAVGGAREVVQVDISTRALGWAKENYEMNSSLIKGSVRFIKDDTIRYMRREVRRREKEGKTYDLIVLDPPTFGSSKGVRFQVNRDLQGLLDLGLSLLSDRGSLLITSNKMDLKADQILDIVRECISNLGFRAGKLETVRPPLIDFPAQEASPVMRGVWVSDLTTT